MSHRLAIIAPFVAVVLVISACGDDASDDATSTTSSTSSTSTSTSTTDTSSPEDPSGTQPVVWPPEDSDQRYDDPVEAASGFATELVGFTDPVLGTFREGDSRSGEVEIRPGSDGPVTTVFVRQVDSDDSWSVIGAATDQIRVTTPSALEEISSPVQLGGESTAFEGTVQVSVHDRSGGAPLAESFVTGGSMGELGEFSSSLEFDDPATADGSLVFYTISMEDGRVMEASVLSVTFAD